MGYINAISALPKFMILPKLDDVIANLIKHSLLPRGSLEALLRGDKDVRLEAENSVTFIWSEARRESVKGLANVVNTIGFSENTNGNH